MKILYLEDNAADTDLARRSLARTRPEWEICMAASLAEARAQLAETDFDLLLLDLRLPDGNGLELLAELREQQRPLAVVALTGQGDEATAVAALHAGADDYITKRHDYLDQLPATLEAELKHRREQKERMSAVLRVLYAEHHPADVDLTLRHLASHAPHIRVQTVASAAEVIARLPAGPASACDFDVLLLDYRLPGDDGLDLLKLLRQRGFDLPVVVVTGQGDEAIAVHSLRLGAAGYLVKHPHYLVELPIVLESVHFRYLLERQQRHGEGLVKRQAELIERLQRRESQLSHAQRLANMGSWEFDRRNKQLIWSEQTYCIFGVEPGSYEPSLEGFLEFVHPEDRERMTQLTSSFDDTEPLEFEYRITRPDGEERILYQRGQALLDEQGEPIRELGVVMDLTPRRRGEEQLRQLQRLEAIGQLTGGIAHDFNNLLTIIMGNAELLEGELTDQPRPHHLAEMIGMAAQRGADLTHRLLAFARRQALEPRSVNANELISGIHGLLQRTLGEHVELVIQDTRPLWFTLADPGQLEGALLNLCINARDAMQNGGALTIETRNTALDEDYVRYHPDVTPGQYVLVAVSDTGSGIAPELLPRVFDPFFTTKGLGKGTGLGLSMVYGFIKQSQGHIKIYSEPGHGTTVKMYLPRAESPHDQTDQIPRPISDYTGSEKVLLVEDDDLVRQHAEEVLGSLGYQVVTAADGADALDAIQKHPDVELLFTDVIMPGGMDGGELADRVTRMMPGIRVLFTSGYPEDVIVRQGRLVSGASLLRKPYLRLDLARKVREVLALPRQ